MAATLVIKVEDQGVNCDLNDDNSCEESSLIALVIGNEVRKFIKDDERFQAACEQLMDELMSGEGLH